MPGQSTGTATILVNAGGDNFILIVKGANGDLTPADVEAAGEDLAACDLILLQLEVPLETVYAALAFGKRHGVKTALNPAPAVRNLDMGTVRLASFLTPNETELAILTGMPVGSEDEIAAAAKSLLAQGLETVIVTLGARGSLLATAEGLKRIAPAKVQAIDSTGAGDAFIGAFARYFAAGLRPRRRSTGRPSMRPIRSRSAARRSPTPRRPSSRLCASGSPAGAEAKPPRRAAGAPEVGSGNSSALVRSGGSGRKASRRERRLSLFLPEQGF